MAAAEVVPQKTADIKLRTAYSAFQSEQAPRSPHTPTLSRSLSSQFGSPGPQRIEDEDIILDIGSRFFRVGIAGEAKPQFVCQYGPDFSRRFGDHSHWLTRSYAESTVWTDWELWDYETSNLDLELVEDRLERVLRTSLEKHLVLDIKNRTAVVALPPALPDPLLELVLRTIFSASNHPKSMFLTSSPVLCTVAAGLRSALVVELGWHETTVTVIYEYREVSQSRSVRAGKFLARELEKTLSSLPELAGHHARLPLFSIDHALMSQVWCRSGDGESAEEAARSSSVVKVDVRPDLAIPVNFGRLADPVEHLVGRASDEPATLDLHDAPVSLLMWKALSALPPDVRGICMSRIVFTGGCSNIRGIKNRLLHELELRMKSQGWDPINYGKRETRLAPESRQGHGTDQTETRDIDEAREHDPTRTDEISKKLARESARARPSVVQGKVRAVRTLGAWAGASMMSHLRVEGSVEIQADEFLKHGMSQIGYPIR